MKQQNNNILGWGIPAIFFCCFLYVATKKTIETNRVKNEGVCVKAYVYKKKHVGAKGTINTYYQFIHNGRYYYDISTNDDNAQVGDSITIVYLESDPQISRSNRFLEKNCSCDD